MCGIFGFVTRDENPIDLEILGRIATETEKRGGHAWGLAWIDRAGRLHSYKRPGKISEQLEDLIMVKDARVVVGHCRYATHGDPKNNLNNHPFPCDGGWLVHNGVIRGHRKINLENDLWPTTDCDSETLALLIERLDGTLAERCLAAADLVDSAPLAAVGIWKPGKLVVVKRGNPLSAGVHKSGIYFGSLREGLPGKVFNVAEGVAVFTPQSADAEWPTLIPHADPVDAPCGKRRAATNEYGWLYDDVPAVEQTDADADAESMAEIDDADSDAADLFAEDSGPRYVREPFDDDGFASGARRARNAPPLRSVRLGGSVPRFDYFRK